MHATIPLSRSISTPVSTSRPETESEKTSARIARSRAQSQRDMNIFGFDAKHLRTWSMPIADMLKLPSPVRESLYSLQEAGAAASTAFDRVYEKQAELPEVSVCPLDPVPSSLDALTQQVVTTKLHDHQESLTGNKDPSELPCSPLLSAQSQASSVYRSSSMSSSVISTPLTNTTRSNSTSCDPPKWLPLLPLPSPEVKPTLPPVEPIPEKSPPGTPAREPTTHFAHHHDLRTAQYLIELATLRRESLVQLRHSLGAVSREWDACKRDVLHEQHLNDARLKRQERKTKIAALRDCGYDSEADDLQFAEHDDLPPADEGYDRVFVVDSDVDTRVQRWLYDKQKHLDEMEAEANRLNGGMKVALGWGSNGATGWS